MDIVTRQQIWAQAEEKAKRKKKEQFLLERERRKTLENVKAIMEKERAQKRVEQSGRFYRTFKSGAGAGKVPKTMTGAVMETGRTYRKALMSGYTMGQRRGAKKFRKSAMGLVTAFIPTTSARSGAKGRPRQSFKYQIPGYGPVPIHIWKKYLQQQKVKMRLMEEMRKARYGAYMPEDPRNQPADYEDVYLEQAEQQQAMQRPQQQMSLPPQIQQPTPQYRKPSLFSRMARIISPPISPLPPMSAGAGMGMPSPVRMWGDGIREDPQNNILKARNIFNNAGDTQIMP